MKNNDKRRHLPGGFRRVHLPVVMGAFLDINNYLFLNALNTSIQLSAPEYLILERKKKKIPCVLVLTATGPTMIHSFYQKLLIFLRRGNGQNVASK